MNVEQHRRALHERQTHSLKLGFGAALLVVAAWVVASYPLNGTLDGNITGFDICLENVEGELISVSQSLAGSMSLQCTESPDGSFSCSGTVIDALDGSSIPVQLSGQNVEGSIGGSWSFDDVDDSGSGSFGGSFDGTNAQILFTAQSQECSLIEVSADLVFTEGGVAVRGTITVGEETDAASGTSSAVLSRTVTGQVNTISSRASGALKGGMRRGSGVSGNNRNNGAHLNMHGSTGLNAGEGMAMPMGAWFNYSYSDFDDDFAATAFDATRHSFLGGVDFNPFQPILAGIAFGYETADFDTAFNGGEQETDGWTISPYLAASLSDTFSVDVVMGYSDMDTNQFRSVGATRVTSSFGADRWFFGGNINAVKPWGNWFFTGSVGWIWAREYQDEFVESNGNTVAERKIKLGNWHVGGEAAYSWGNWEPWASATYGRDYQFTEIQIAGAAQQPANDRDDILLGLGLRYYHPMGISASLGWNKRVDRTNYDEDTINFLMRMDF